jgi:subtilase family serine protease
MRFYSRYITTALVLTLVLGAIPFGASGDDSRSPGADMIVDEVFLVDPTIPKVGDNVTINATISNVGDENATNVTVVFEAKNGTTTIPLETLHLGHDNGGTNITADGSNNPVNITIYWNTSVTNFTVMAGLIYTVEATAFNETDANVTNGTNSFQISFQAPDIKDPFVDNITASPTEVIVGENVTINASLKNSGALNATDEPVFFYMDYDPMASANTEIYNITVFIERWNQSTSHVEFNWNTTGVAIGNHTVSAVIPSNGNNMSTENITINDVPPPPMKPDLIISNLAFEFDEVLVGAVVNLSVYIKNVGNEASTATTLEIRDLNGTYLNTEDIPVINATKGFEVIYQVNTTFINPGEHTFRAWADMPSSNDEFNETNNTALTNITITALPDLTVSNIYFRLPGTDVDVTEVTEGEEVIIFANIKNRGLESSLNGTNVTYYLDNLTKPIGWKITQSFSKGANYNVSFKWNTTNVTPRKHTIFVFVDSEDINEEMDEENNIMSINFTIKEIVKYPDLTLRDLRILKDPFSTGDEVDISVILQNMGPGNASDVPITFKLETTSGGTLLEIDQIFIPFVEGNGEKFVPLLWTYDQTLAEGEYQIRAIVDPDNLIEELNETNNDNTTAVNIIDKVEPATDLSISDVKFDPEKPKKGDTVKITVTIKNMGDLDAINVDVVLKIEGQEIDKVTVPFVGKNSTATADLEFKTDKKGTQQLTIELHDDGVMPYQTTRDLEIKAAAEAGMDWIMIMLVVIILIVILIGIGMAARGRGARPEYDEDAAVPEEEEAYAEEE